MMAMNQLLNNPAVYDFFNCIYLDNSNDRIRLPKHASTDFGTGDFTIFGWIYTPENPATLAVKNIVSKFIDSSNRISLDLAPQTVASGGGYVFQGQYRNAGTLVTAQIASGTKRVSLNAWHFFAFRRSGNSVNAFLNSLKGSTATDAAILNVTFNTDWYMGDDLNTGITTFTKMYIDDLCFANVALSDSQLKEIYNSGAGKDPYSFVASTSPLYRANELTGVAVTGDALLRDSSSNAVHGVMTGYAGQIDFVNHYTLT